MWRVWCKWFDEFLRRPEVSVMCRPPTASPVHEPSLRRRREPVLRQLRRHPPVHDRRGRLLADRQQQEWDAGLMDEPATARTRLRSFSPVFPVRDLRRALAHYASLGFDVQPYTEGDGYGFADRDRVSLHLSLDTGHEHESGGEDGHDHEHVGTAYLYVADADALYDEWTRPGVGGLTRRVGDTPYELREGSHVDPDG